MWAQSEVAQEELGEVATSNVAHIFSADYLFIISKVL